MLGLPTYEQQQFASALEELDGVADVTSEQVVKLAEQSGVDLALLLREHLQDEEQEE